MKKIPSLFVKDYEVHEHENRITGGTTVTKGRFLATEQVTPGCEWVINGEGVATRKWDGTAVRIDWSDTSIPIYSKRYDAKQGKTPPTGFEPCQEPDPITGHWPGWVPINPNNPEDKWLCEAYNTAASLVEILSSGTYEAIGPKINGFRDKDHVWPNDRHILAKHGTFILEDAPPVRNYETLRRYLSYKSMEGIVFHHPDGHMCKVKRSDFGLPW